jgi:hypothetical protein
VRSFAVAVLPSSSFRRAQPKWTRSAVGTRSFSVRRIIRKFEIKCHTIENQALHVQATLWTRAQTSEVCRAQHADLYNEFVPAASRKISATIKSLGERSKERHTPCVASAPIPHACASGKAECPRCTERRPNRTSEHRPSGSRGQPGRTPPIGVLPGTEAKIAP